MTRGRPARVPVADRPPFAKRLAELRKKAGLSQAKLAIQTGLSQSVIGDYETGKTFPTIKAAKQLSDALGDDLYGTFTNDKASQTIQSPIYAEAKSRVSASSKDTYFLLKELFKLVLEKEQSLLNIQQISAVIHQSSIIWPMITAFVDTDEFREIGYTLRDGTRVWLKVISANYTRHTLAEWVSADQAAEAAETRER